MPIFPHIHWSRLYSKFATLFVPPAGFVKARLQVPLIGRNRAFSLADRQFSEFLF